MIKGKNNEISVGIGSSLGKYRSYLCSTYPHGDDKTIWHGDGAGDGGYENTTTTHVLGRLSWGHGNGSGRGHGDIINIVTEDVRASVLPFMPVELIIGGCHI